METIEIQVTKLYKILSFRAMTQKDLHSLISETNNGETISMYILNEIINGKRKNFNITVKLLYAKFAVLKRKLLKQFL